MKWTKEAGEAISKVPFFVRPRVRRRVEEEAARCRAGEVRLEHVQTCQRRFLNRMEEEVQGYQVETCFGPSGCPNRAVNSDGLAQRIEGLLVRRQFRAFLAERVARPLKIHHEFRVSVSDCPNACSRPQIVDLGLIGAQLPKVSEETCIQCGACVEACREEAVSLSDRGPTVDFAKCLACGKCISACPTGSLQEAARGFRILAGGKLGRRPKLAEELPGIHRTEEALEVIDQFLDHYQRHCQRGERLGEVLERTGIPQREAERAEG